MAGRERLRAVSAHSATRRVNGYTPLRVIRIIVTAAGEARNDFSDDGLSSPQEARNGTPVGAVNMRPSHEVVVHSPGVVTAAIDRGNKTWDLRKPKNRTEGTPE